MEKFKNKTQYHMFNYNTTDTRNRGRHNEILIIHTSTMST